MPFLMVNLDDLGDCQRGIQQLRGRLRRAGVEPHPDHGARPAGAANRIADGANPPVNDQGPAGLPLKQKLNRISQRGVWRFISGIAQLDNTPRSLAELDEALKLPPNKMRSTKAIFAKLEQRFELRFLKPADDGSADDAGNPRYVMPPRIRKHVREMVG